MSDREREGGHKRSENSDRDRQRKRDTRRDGDGMLYYCFLLEM